MDIKLISLLPRNAGDGNLDVQIIHDESQIEVPVRLIDNKDNTYTVELTPPETGSYTTNLHYGGLKVPLVPKVVISPTVDMTKIKVDGLEPSKLHFFYFLLVTVSSSQEQKQLERPKSRTSPNSLILFHSHPSPPVACCIKSRTFE